MIGKEVTRRMSRRKSIKSTSKQTATPPQAPSHDKKESSNLKAIESFFEVYREPREEHIGPDGMLKFCKDLNVELDDAALVVLSWNMNAKTMGFYSKPEWTRGLQQLKVENLEKLKNMLPTLRKSLKGSDLKQIYEYAFGFAKDPEQKAIDLSTAIQLLDILLLNSFPIIGKFTTFLKQQDSYKVMNRDQWVSIYEFCKTVKPDFSNYDDSAHWPVLFDEFVEWVREQKK